MKNYINILLGASLLFIVYQYRYFLANLIGITTKPKWVRTAEEELGTAEIAGSQQNNPRIIEYHASTSGKFTTDEIHWCSSFMNWVIENSGLKGTNSARALSWANWGYKLDKPALGSIAVFSYGEGRGHVGIVVGEEGGKLQILGGNQSNKVSISKYGTSQIVAYVYPTGYAPTPEDYILKPYKS